MTASRSPVAVLLFTRSAGEEAAHKRFVSHGPRPDNAGIAAQFIAQATATGSQAGADFICVDSARQAGASFGERLAGAMAHTFALGYAHVLVIGNDCPQLDAALLRRAVAAVGSGQPVLGPATDGGVYLLGVSRALFAKADWVGLPWQTARLGAALLQLLRRQEPSVFLLPTLADVDNERDLARLLRQPLARHLRRRLGRLRAGGKPNPGPARMLARNRPLVAPQPLRGPPSH